MRIWLDIEVSKYRYMKHSTFLYAFFREIKMLMRLAKEEAKRSKKAAAKIMQNKYRKLRWQT